MRAPRIRPALVLAAVTVACALFSAPAPAEAGDWKRGPHVTGGYYYYEPPPPRFYRPPPRYYAPPPAYYAPPPRYYAPPPAYYYPPPPPRPRYYAPPPPPGFGFHFRF